MGHQNKDVVEQHYAGRWPWLLQNFILDLPAALLRNRKPANFHCVTATRSEPITRVCAIAPQSKAVHYGQAFV